jgi:hypothetical protein
MHSLVNVSKVRLVSSLPNDLLRIVTSSEPIDELS